MEKFKYGLLRVINVSGLTFLEPVVRLCYGEEPRLQLKKIGQFIVIPVCAFVLFLVFWSGLAPLLRTKSGEVPTPDVVYSAAQGIMKFHERENDKQVSYALGGEQRQAELKAVEQEIEAQLELKKAADLQVLEAEAAKKERIAAIAAPLMAAYETRKAEFDKAGQLRLAAIEKKASQLDPKDINAKNDILAYLRGHETQSDAEQAELEQLKSALDDATLIKFGPLKQAQVAQTVIAEQIQYLVKKREMLESNNKSLKLEEQYAKLKGIQKQYATATGPSLVQYGQQLLKQEERIAAITKSDYAKPWTLPLQIVRSLACVFAGFFLSTAIAIPIGILCGISKTFMAAMTPFIALFKPVSPIVWLPISLIVVGGFIPDPDKHWFIKLLAELPLIGWMKINPAFIASAITVALCSLWPTLVNTALGVASIDKDHINVARVLQLSFTQRLIKIVVPSAMPLIFAGLRISLGVGWMVLIAAELLSSSEGIGKFVWDMFNNGSSETFAQMFVVVFVVGVVGLLLDRIMIVFQRLVSFDGAPAAI